MITSNNTVEFFLKFQAENNAINSTTQAIKGLENAGKGASATIGDTIEAVSGLSRATSFLQSFGEKIKSGVSNPLESATGAIDGFLSKGGAVGVMLAVLSVGAIEAGSSILQLVESQGRIAEASVNMADTLGISIGAAEQLEAQAGLTGVAIGSLDGAARTVGAALEDSSGAGAKMAQALEKLGVKVRTSRGEMREMGPVILELLDKLSGIESDSERAFTAMQTLPRGAATALLPLIKNLDETRAAVQSAGVGLNEGLTRKLAEADDALGRVALSWQQLKRELAGGIVGSITIKVADFLSGFGSQAAPTLDGRKSLIDQSTNFRPGRGPVPNDTLGFLTDFAKNQGLEQQAAAFRAQQGKTQDGLRARLGDVERNINDLVGALSSAIDSDVRAIKSKELAAARAEKASIERALQPAVKKDSGDLKLSDLLARSPTFRRSLPPSLFRAGEVLQVETPTGRSAAEVERDNLKTFGEEMLKAEKARRDLEKERRDFVIDSATRLVELGDNEYKNALRVRDIRLAAAETEIDRARALIDYQVRVSEITKARERASEENAGKVYDALRRDGASGGLGGLISGLRDQVGRQLFVNASSGLFGSLSSIGGKLGRALPEPIGKLFKGTFLDPNNAESATDRNTTATEKLTTEIEKLRTAAETGGLGGGLGSIPGLAGVASDLNGLTGGGSGGNGAGGSLGALSKLPGFKGANNFLDGIFGKGKGGAAAAGIGAGAFQVFSGFKSGDKGQIASGVLSAASAIPGPQQPFVQAGALLAGLFGGLLGSGRRSFDAEQNALLASRKAVDPTADSRTFDLSGNNAVFDRDFRGSARVLIQRTIQLSINALDSASIASRREDISQAVADAIDAGLVPINGSINRAVFGAGV